MSLNVSPSFRRGLHGIGEVHRAACVLIYHVHIPSAAVDCRFSSLGEQYIMAHALRDLHMPGHRASTSPCPGRRGRDVFPGRASERQHKPAIVVDTAVANQLRRGARHHGGGGSKGRADTAGGRLQRGVRCEDWSRHTVPVCQPRRLLEPSTRMDCWLGGCLWGPPVRSRVPPED
jgi:hypothetical protein